MSGKAIPCSPAKKADLRCFANLKVRCPKNTYHASGGEGTAAEADECEARSSPGFVFAVSALAVFPRRCRDALLEGTLEMALVGKAELQGGVGDAHALI